MPDDDDPKEELRPLPTRSKMEANLMNIQSNQELLETAMQPMSCILFSRYEALQRAGFTPDQAFQIILARGLD